MPYNGPKKMCGIIMAAETGEKAEIVNNKVLLQFEDQKERGTQGYGIVKIDEEMNYKVDRATEGYKFMWDMHQDPTKIMMVHHRIPTSSENKIKQTHPFLIEDGSLKYDYLLMHNGVIQNDDKLKEEHEKLGFTYKTEDGKKYNDSECLAIEIARFIEEQVSVVGTEGSAAFIGLQIDKKTKKVIKLFFGRNEGNPLNMYKTRGKIFLSSTGPGSEVQPFFLYSCKLDKEMKLSKKAMAFKEIKKISYFLEEETGGIYPYQKGEYFKNRATTTKGDERGADFSKYLTKQDPFEKQKEEDEMEDETKLMIAIEDASVKNQETLDNFYDLLYDEGNINLVGEKDVDEVVKKIKDDLLEMIDNAKIAKMEDEMKKEFDESRI